MAEDDEKPTIAEEGPPGDTAVISGDAVENTEGNENNDAQSEDSAKDGANEVVDEDGEGSDGGLPKKKRLCRHPGCIRVIKSQGHCQRHGAKAKRCKVAGCDKQAQGTHDGVSVCSVLSIVALGFDTKVHLSPVFPTEDV
jgi:hypothetical protein